MAKSFKVTLKRGLMGTTKKQQEAIRCLGLRYRSHEVVVKDTPANRGQIYKVHHLLEVKIQA